MKRLAIALTGLSALALTACASLAPYGQQRGSGGQGYSERRIESNRYRVTYNGVGAAVISLTKNGIGNWTLSGVNGYTGATTINSGTLTLDATTSAAATACSIWAPPAASGAWRSASMAWR